MLKLVMASFVALTLFAGIAIPRANTAEAVGEASTFACIKLEKAWLTTGVQALYDTFQRLGCTPI